MMGNWNGKRVLLNGISKFPFRMDISMSTVIQVFAFAATLYAAVHVMRADVDRLEKSQAQMAYQLQTVMESQQRMTANIESLREEVRYYRQKLDRLTELHMTGSNPKLRNHEED
ncbi:MAG: hypothetical protein ABIN58_00815 [candidate division WOR-3 bacterium]